MWRFYTEVLGWNAPLSPMASMPWRQKQTFATGILDLGVNGVPLPPPPQPLLIIGVPLLDCREWAAALKANIHVRQSKSLMSEMILRLMSSPRSVPLSFVCQDTFALSWGGGGGGAEEVLFFFIRLQTLSCVFFARCCWLSMFSNTFSSMFLGHVVV